MVLRACCCDSALIAHAQTADRRHLCNENQLHVLFILSSFRQSTSTCFGHICSPSPGGILYIYNNWFVSFFLLTVCCPSEPGCCRVTRLVGVQRSASSASPSTIHIQKSAYRYKYTICISDNSSHSSQITFSRIYLSLILSIYSNLSFCTCSTNEILFHNSGLLAYDSCFDR